ncbi:27736_t:CDS:1 [Racocetra persica]|uniref:27736_t:CDS:1 n=1 Tax=Racocetra persica TaxID=160502 RepID=A0ACA9RD02_9GLOM|nr:27736_t:CDS:1 [Racocetra persica]
MFDEIQKLQAENERLTKENKELRRLSLQTKIQDLANKVDSLTKLAEQNLKVGERLLEKGLVDNINAYTENNRRIAVQVQEYQRQSEELEQALKNLEIVAQQEQK